MRSFSTSLVLVSFVFGAASCGSSPPGSKPDGSATGGSAPAGGHGGDGIGGRGGIGGGGGVGGAPVDVADPAAQAKSIAELRAAIASDRPADAAGFASRWPAKYLSG